MIVKVQFTEITKNLPVKFVESGGTLHAKMGEIHKVTEYIGGEEYEGAYEVTPKVEAQTMQTKNKVLIDDMTIKGIEIHRVKNNGGGTTVYIAKGD